MSYSVNYWGSHPKLGNDDCWTGCDYSFEDEAREAFNKAPSAIIPFDTTDAEYIELDGPGVYEVRKNPEWAGQSTNDDMSDWAHEIAREEGMLGGINSYNDAMGY